MRGCSPVILVENGAQGLRYSGTRSRCSGGNSVRSAGAVTAAAAGQAAENRAFIRPLRRVDLRHTVLGARICLISESLFNF